MLFWKNKEFISIVDRDTTQVNNDKTNIIKKQFEWDVYHIENYLLDEKYIFQVLQDLEISETELNSSARVLEDLKKCASEVIDFHHQHELNLYVKNEVYSSLTFSSKGETEREKEYYTSVTSSLGTLSKKVRIV